MSSDYWAGACEWARVQESGDSSVLYGAQLFAVACFVCSTVFSGLWLFRWHALKRSNPGLLHYIWRFLGRFLCLSFFCGVFGIAAWVTKVGQINSLVALSQPQQLTNATICQLSILNLPTRVQANKFQAAFRIFYSLEVACLFLYIIFGLDRINEQAQSARSLSLRDVPSESSGSGLSSTQKSGAIRGQQELLPSASRSPSAGSSGSSQAKFSRTRVLQLLFKSGLAFVALCFIVFFISIIIGGFIQTRIVVLLQSAYDDCNRHDFDAQASLSNERSANELFDSILLPSQFTGFLTEFAAAIVVILLYVAGGCLGVSIVGTARRTIESSRVKLRQLQVTIGNQHDAKAASAGAAARPCFCLIPESFYFVVTFCCSVERTARCHDHRERQDAAAGCILLHCCVFVWDSSRICRLLDVRKFAVSKHNVQVPL
jgi:hypothetical protein